MHCANLLLSRGGSIIHSWSVFKSGIQQSHCIIYDCLTALKAPHVHVRVATYVIRTIEGLLL